MADSTRTSSGFTQGTSTTAGASAGEKRDNGAGAGQAMVDSAGQAVTEAKKMGSELVGAVRESAVSLLDTQRSRAADQIAAVGDALKQSAKSLEGTSGATVVDYADRAAQQITGFADTIRNRSWGDLASDVEGFARRWPVAFLTASFGIGFMAGRFMLSSAEAAREATADAMPQHSATPAQPQHGRNQRDTPTVGGSSTTSTGAGKPTTGASAAGE